MTDYLALAKALADRPSESSLIVHTVGMSKVNGGMYAHCAPGCPWDAYTEGSDPSAKAWLREQMHNHMAGVQ
jgi:hypothetical protein